MSQAEQIKILEVSIRSERFVDGKKLLVAGDGAGVGVELVIYENIYMPYLTGAILIQDDNNFYGEIGINGTERLVVRMQTPGAIEEIEKTFVLSTVQKQIKVNDQLSQLLFTLTEDHGYFNELQLINKSYNGTGSEIIQKILEDNTNKSIKPDYHLAPAQGKFRYIVPWQSAYQAIHTVLNYMTTDNFLPYFLFSSITSDNLILTDLESILKREPFTRPLKQAFSYAVNKKEENSIIEKAFNIVEINSSEMNDTLSLAKMGAVGASGQSIDTTSGSATDFRIDMKQQYNFLNDANVISLKEDNYPIDDLFRVDTQPNTPITDLDSKRYSIMASLPYDNINGLVSDNNASQQIVIKNNYIKLLANNAFEITVPGFAFGVKHTNRSVGHTVDIAVLKEGNDVMDNANQVDPRRSGTFVMLAKKHVFNLVEESHNVVVNVGRITEPKRIQRT